MPVLEIAEGDQVPFPGSGKLLLTFHERGEMVSDRRYAAWQVALSHVQNIYPITDSFQRQTGSPVAFGPGSPALVLA